MRREMRGQRCNERIAVAHDLDGIIGDLGDQGVQPDIVAALSAAGRW
jgi:hypothetical protein